MALAATAALAILPASAAVTGTITTSKTFVSPVGTAAIDVADADLNVLSAAVQDATGSWGSIGTTIFFSLKDTNGDSGTGAFAATSTGDEISGTPTITAVTAGAIADFVVVTAAAKTGRVSIQYVGAAPPGVTSMTLDYKLATVNTTTADVTSPADGTGVKVILKETGASTGIYRGVIQVGTKSIDALAASATPDQIFAVAGQVLTIKYTDASPAGARQTTMTVENTKPVGVLKSPVDNSATTSASPKLIVDFTDTDSLVDAGTITFNVTNATGAGDVDLNTAPNKITQTVVTTTAITNGFTGEVTLSSFPADTTVLIRWNAQATDKAGNVGVTDANSVTAGVNDDFTVIHDKQGPFYGTATASAGAWYNTTTDKVMTKPTQSIDTSIGIMLPAALDIAGTANDVAESLSAASVTTADFRIKNLKKADGSIVGGTAADADLGIVPTAAIVYAKAPNWIFLTVPAMAPDAKPSILLKDSAAGITDTAGNSTTTGTVVASDKQAPVVAAVLDRSLHKTDATLTVTTNEAGAPPTVKANNGGAITPTPTADPKVFTVKVAPGADGAYALSVVQADANGNSTILGSTTPTKDFPKTGEIALYVDSALPAPTVTVNNVTAAGASVETSVPFFITTAYSNEGKEYGLNSAGAMILIGNASPIVDDLDVHNTVTIATALLDGTSILAQLDSQDNITFNFALADITTGAHVLQIFAKDAAGHVNDSGKINFTVIARKAYKVGVSAGWNLISFPGTPSNTAIDSVLPAAHPATDVLSFQNGQWVSASRLGGVWDGKLTTIDGDHAYWVNTTSSEAIGSLLALPAVGTAQSPPSVSVNAGWNLVPVIDLDQAVQGAAGSTATADAYFTSITWSIGYTYASNTRTWTRLSKTGGTVANGQGVWVWADKAGTLIP